MRVDFYSLNLKNLKELYFVLFQMKLFERKKCFDQHNLHKIIALYNSKENLCTISKFQFFIWEYSTAKEMTSCWYNKEEVSWKILVCTTKISDSQS